MPLCAKEMEHYAKYLHWTSLTWSSTLPSCQDWFWPWLSELGFLGDKKALLENINKVNFIRDLIWNSSHLLVSRCSQYKIIVWIPSSLLIHWYQSAMSATANTVTGTINRFIPSLCCLAFTEQWLFKLYSRWQHGHFILCKLTEFLTCFWIRRAKCKFNQMS